MKVSTLTLTFLALSSVASICHGCRTANSDKPRPLNVEAERHREKAKDLLLNQRLDEGLSSFREAILLDPQEAWPYQFVFDVCRDMKVTDRAISIFQDATQAKPDNALAYDYLGAAYCSVSRYEDAIAAYQEVVRITPDDEEAHYTLGSLYMMVGNKEEALNKYEDLRELEAGSWVFSREREKYARRAGQLIDCIRTGNIVLYRGVGLGWSYYRGHESCLTLTPFIHSLSKLPYPCNSFARTPQGLCSPMPNASVSDCTTTQHKTHGTELEVHYRWHPWFGLKVIVKRFYTRRGLASLYAVLDLDCSLPILEIPSWMLDRASCAHMRLAQHPFVGFKHLLAVKDLLRFTAPDSAVGVIDNQHPGPLPQGDADEKRDQSIPLATGSVSATSDKTSLADPSPGSAAQTPAPSASTVSSGPLQRRHLPKKGGSR